MKTLTAALAVAASLTTLSPAAAGAAEAAVHPNASQNICYGSPVPTGWMITAWTDWYQCGTPNSYIYDAEVITDVSGTPSGGSATACQQPPPAGFYATALSYSFQCEGSKTPNGLLNNQQTVTNLNGLPSGTTKIICGIQTAPSGWVETAVVQTYLCVLAHGGGVGDNAIQIRKV